MTEPLEMKDLSALAGKVRTDAKIDRIRALAQWDAMGRDQKKKLGLPTTVRAFAISQDVVENRIHKDRKDPLYAKFLEEAKEAQALRLDPRGSSALSDTKRSDMANDDLSVYEQLKGQLAQDAMSGDSKSLEQWMKLFGAPFIQDEAKRVDEVSGLDDRALVEEVIELVDTDLLISIMKDRGLI